MTVRDIILAHLRKVGADGLCNHDCGCSIEDMGDCCEPSMTCVPARKTTVKEGDILHECGDAEIGDDMFVPIMTFRPFRPL